jgi:peptidyl-dipeptidase Dcp
MLTTLFHEFGHALQVMLANTTYLVCLELRFIGILLPSQVMENWCAHEPEALALFAKHYETGGVIPQEYVEK